MKREGVFVSKGDEKAIKPKSFFSDFWFFILVKNVYALAIF